MGQKRIMVVDDDVFTRDLIKTQLRSIGIETVEAANGAEALQKAGTGQSHLIVLDIIMPGMNGFDVCEQLKTDPRTGSVPVVFISSRMDQADRQRAMRLGALDVFTKPFSLKKFSEKVLEILSLA
jgi:CheY-like chemotaxis protein